MAGERWDTVTSRLGWFKQESLCSRETKSIPEQVSDGSHALHALHDWGLGFREAVQKKGLVRHPPMRDRQAIACSP